MARGVPQPCRCCPRCTQDEEVWLLRAVDVAPVYPEWYMGPSFLLPGYPSQPGTSKERLDALEPGRGLRRALGSPFSLPEGPLESPFSSILEGSKALRVSNLSQESWFLRFSGILTFLRSVDIPRGVLIFLAVSKLIFNSVGVGRGL